ncbi:MAG TPA: type II secretion system F family protein [Rhizomicrobium sp.]|nr:type II secretion system F family protein [Rhizomicrobium sp.]
MFFYLAVIVFMLAVGGAAYAFAGAGGEASRKRLAAVSGPAQATGAGGRAPASDASRRKNVQALLKDIEKQNAASRERPTMRRRLEQAGLSIEPRSFYIVSGIAGLCAAAACMLFKLPLLATLGIAFTVGLGLPRWVIGFLKNRRLKAFTVSFADAIDAIVRSVKSGLPTNEALKLIAREMPDPVGSEFSKLVEGLKVGVTLEQGLKRMYESMPTSEVSFFAIVMTIQQKSGGNLSEALSNLSGVLRDRKRLQGKIRAMSSEAKASAMIIGSLPPMVAFLVWMSTPTYIEALFTERMGNLMLLGCAVWMSVGIFVMKKMIDFKH